MNTNRIPREIEVRLDAVRSRIRRVQRLRGIAVTGTVALAGLILIMAADYLFAPLPGAARWVLFAGWLIAVAGAAKFGFAPVFRKIGLIQIARWLECRHPEMEERLSTVLEISHEGSNVSPGFLEALSAAAEKDIGGVDAVSELRSAAQSHRRWLRPAFALLGLLLLSLVLWPGEAGRLLVRAVAPFSDIGNAGAASFTVSPGNLEVLAGDSIEIEIGYTGRSNQVDLWMERADGTKFSQTLTRSGDGFRYVLHPARESFRYRIRAGRDESDAFTATVWPLPEIRDPRVAMKFPEYTRLPDLTSSLGRGVEAVAGTSVTLSGTTNTAIEEAWLEIDGERLADGRIESSASGGRIAFEWLLEPEGSGEAVAMLRHRLGREVEALRFRVEVLEDRPPVVLLISPFQRELRVRPDEVFSMRYEVTEDFALQTLEFEVEAGETKVLPQDLPMVIPGSKPQRFRGAGEVVVGSLRSMFAGTNEMRIRVKAADARPPGFGGPGVGYSEWVRLIVDQSAESFARQELRQEHDGARETIEEAIRDAREARERMDWHRDQLKNDQLPENARQHFQEAAEKLASATEKLEELASRMEDSVHAPKADPVEKAAEALQEARENLENVPLQDTAEQRQQTLADARQLAEDAIRDLEAVRQNMDEDRQRVQDLARMQDLAQEQRELARQAEENLLARNDETPQIPQDWQQRQQQMEEALRQQLRERPDARAEALQAQAEQAKALAEQARSMAEAQQDMREQSQQMAENQDASGLEDAIREALAEAQAGITAEAKAELSQALQDRNNLANALPEAAAAAEKTQEQMAAARENAASDQADAAEATKAAAESAKAAAEAMKESAAQADAASPTEAAQAESLQSLAERQEAIASAMEALADGDPAAAFQALQEAGAEAAGELAEAIQSMPAVENSGAMGEAAGNASEGTSRAESAAAQGQQGEPREASSQHEQSAQNFERTAAALERAAEEFSQAAGQAASQSGDSNKAPLPAAELADAFQQASEAADSSSPGEAAMHAANAADALARAVQEGRRQMQGMPGTPGMPGPPDARPGEEVSEDPRRPGQLPPGLPPELARLGISASDWEKIQATLRSDVGAGGADAVPEEYRGLVRGYFESMSKTTER